MHLFGQKTKILESNNPQEPCYVFVQYQTRKALEDRMLRALQHPPVFLKTAMAPPKGGKAGEELVKTLGGPTFHSKHCELSCEVVKWPGLQIHLHYQAKGCTDCVPSKSFKLWHASNGNMVIKCHDHHILWGISKFDLDQWFFKKNCGNVTTLTMFQANKRYSSLCKTNSFRECIRV